MCDLSKHPSDERLRLEGGLSQTGRPAEIVRIKDGKSISLRTGKVIHEGSPQSLKRSMSEESDDEMVRSMARRRKSALPVVKDVQKCSECEKTFKRPCDLTCVPSCLYIILIQELIEHVVNMRRRIPDHGNVVSLPASTMNMAGPPKKSEIAT